MKSLGLTTSSIIIWYGSLAAAFISTPVKQSIHIASSALKCNTDPIIYSRRETIKSWTSAALIATSLLSSENANGFPNKISDKYDSRPKQRGAVKGLGVGTRKDMVGEEYLGLKPCGAAPNCFCSTDSAEDDPDHSIPSWKFPDSVSSEAAFEQLYEVVKAYPPGQNDIDGGGFDIVTYDPKKGYIYVQFESLKNGFIDDVEFAVVGDAKNEVQVRSSSRLGYLDFGVNAKRLNYIAKKMNEKGWDARGVELKTHMGYAEENNLKEL